jgi:hypothetical protein
MVAGSLAAATCGSGWSAACCTGVGDPTGVVAGFADAMRLAAAEEGRAAVGDLVALIAEADGSVLVKARLHVPKTKRTRTKDNFG